MASTSQIESLPAAEDPIEVVVGEVIKRLRHETDEPDASLTCNDILRLVGSHSHVLAILLFSLLNLIPAPPGYNFVMALIIIAMCAFLLLGREMKLPGAFGRMRLPVKIVLKLLDVLAILANRAARISSPRWRGLTRDAAVPAVAVLGILLGISMLPPIPFTNMLPSIGLAVVCVGVLNHDGIVVLAGAAVGIIGAVISVAAVWLVIVVGFAIGDVVDGDEPAGVPIPLVRGSG